MGRPGLPLIVLLALLASYVAVGITLVAWPRGEQVYSSGPKLHPPSSAGERAAASAGIAYLRALQRRDADGACQYADGGLAIRLRCDSRPRVPRALRQAPGRLRAIDARVDGTVASVAACGGACVNFLSLRLSGDAWRVVDHHIGGYA